MTFAPALLAALLVAGAEPPAPPPGAKSASPPATPSGAAATKAPRGRKSTLQPASLPTSEGELAAIDHRTHRLVLLTSGGELTLSFDRNTLFSDAAGATTPLRLTAGIRVKVGRDGEQRAAWVEVRPPPSTPRPAP